MKEQLEKLQEWLYDSQYTVVLTGAGMSTESGLPDFRSARGLWKQFEPEQIASVTAMKQHRQDFVEFYKWRIEQLQEYQPHVGYDILTRWQRQGLVQRIITQNVDGFHHQAASHNVIELHGTLRKVTCMGCQKAYPAERYLQEGGEVCPACSDFLRPGVTLFGEALDVQAITEAIEEARKAELFIVMGSSLYVSPANSLPVEAIHQGAKFVILNEGVTQLDSYADMKLEGKIGAILAEVNT